MKTFAIAVRLADIVTLKCNKHGCALKDADQLMDCMALLADMVKRHPQASKWIHEVRQAEAVVSAQEADRIQLNRLEKKLEYALINGPFTKSPSTSPTSTAKFHVYRRESSWGGADHSYDHDSEIMRSVELQRWYVVCSLLLEEQKQAPSRAF